MYTLHLQGRYGEGRKGTRGVRGTREDRGADLNISGKKRWGKWFEEQNRRENKFIEDMVEEEKTGWFMVLMRNVVASIRAPDRSINQVLWKSCHVKHRNHLAGSFLFSFHHIYTLIFMAYSSILKMNTVDSFHGSTTQKQVIFIFQDIRTSETYRISRSEVNAQSACPSTQQKHKDVFPVNGNTYIRNSL